MSSNILFRVNEKELYTHGIIVVVVIANDQVIIIYRIVFMSLARLCLTIEILLCDEFLLILDFAQLFFLFDNVFHILVQLCERLVV